MYLASMGADEDHREPPRANSVLCVLRVLCGSPSVYTNILVAAARSVLPHWPLLKLETDQIAVSVFAEQAAAGQHDVGPGVATKQAGSGGQLFVGIG